MPNRNYGKFSKKDNQGALVGKIGLEEIVFNIQITGTKIKRIIQFCYLGSAIIKENRLLVEIKKRIDLTKQAFIAKKSILLSNISLQEHGYPLQYHSFRILCYKQVKIKPWVKWKKSRIEISEMCIWRKMARTKCNI